MEESKNTTTARKTLFGLSIEDKCMHYKVLGVVAGVWIVYWAIMLVTIHGYNRNWEVRGLFGDMFGALNALFSGLAFAGLIITILYQREELHNNTEVLKGQENEMKLQAKSLEKQWEQMQLQSDAMKRQWEEMEKQNTNIKRQRLESTLLNMWNIHFRIRSEVTVNQNRGMDAIIYSIQTIVNQAIQLTRNGGETSVRLTTIAQAAMIFNNTHGFGPFETYLSSLKLIYRTVKSSDLNKEAEKRYLEMIQGYVSKYEVELIVYYINYMKVRGIVEQELYDMYIETNLNYAFAQWFARQARLDLVFDGGIL